MGDKERQELERELAAEPLPDEQWGMITVPDELLED